MNMGENKLCSHDKIEQMPMRTKYDNSCPLPVAVQIPMSQDGACQDMLCSADITESFRCGFVGLCGPCELGGLQPSEFVTLRLFG